MGICPVLCHGILATRHWQNMGGFSFMHSIKILVEKERKQGVGTGFKISCLKAAR